jgi:hypothetical protein
MPSTPRHEGGKSNTAPLTPEGVVALVTTKPVANASTGCQSIHGIFTAWTATRRGREAIGPPVTADCSLPGRREKERRKTGRPEGQKKAAGEVD